MDATPPHDQHQFDEYLQWLHRSSRLHLKAPYTLPFLAGGSDDDDAQQEDAYDRAARPATQLDRGPLQRVVVTTLTIKESINLT